MNEEKKKTLDRIDARLKDPWGIDTGVFINDCEFLLDLVSSQSEKIKLLTNCVDTVDIYGINILGNGVYNLRRAALSKFDEAGGKDD
jgi:hypothetical protein